MNKSKLRAAEKAEAKKAERRAIEQQYGLQAGVLEPKKPEIGTSSGNLPGYYRTGNLKGVVYRNRSPKP